MYMMTSYDITVDVTDDIRYFFLKCANDQNLVVIYTFHPKWRFHVITILCKYRVTLSVCSVVQWRINQSTVRTQYAYSIHL